MIRNKDTFFKDFKPIKITKEVRKKAYKNPNLPVRQNLGMFYTDSEREKYIAKSLKRRLP